MTVAHAAHHIVTTAAERPYQDKPFRPRPIIDYLVSIDNQPRGWLMSYRPDGTGYYLADLYREPILEPGTSFHVTVATKADFHQRIEFWLEQNVIPLSNAPPNPPKPKYDVMTPEWVKQLPLRDDQQ